MTIDELIAALTEAKKEFGGNLEIKLWKVRGMETIERIAVVAWFPVGPEAKSEIDLVMRLGDN